MAETKHLLANELWLFAGMDDHEVQALLDEARPQIVDYTKRTVVFSPHDFHQTLGFLLRGRCHVMHCRDNGEHTPMNVLHVGDSFGILSLFCEDEYPTTVISDGDTRILFFTKEDIFRMMERSVVLSRNLLSFVCSRVNFLTKKVQALSAGDTLSKLSVLLLQAERTPGEPFPFHATTVARAMGCGRASVYRALCVLEDEGAVLYTDRQIVIKQKHILERISK